VAGGGSVSVTPVPDSLAMDELDVTVVLPVHNEAGHVSDEIERIRKALDTSEFTYEIVVVDDASTDGSSEELDGIDDITLIRFTRNGGSGTARKAGTLAARGRIVVWTDADMTYPNDRIPELVRELDGHDQIVGARTSEQGTAKFARVPAKAAIRKLASYLTRTKIPDLNSGLRAFRRDVGLQFVQLLPAGFSCVTTITMAFLANGYSVKYVPIDYFPRAGRSKFHWWADTRRYLTQVLRMTLSWEPLRVFMPVGLLLLALGTGKLVYDVFDKDWRVATNTLFVFGVAFFVVLTGLLADLLVRLTKPAVLVPPAQFTPRPHSD
jgi:polyisoprenyl-phosphate glycosyltransferase